MANCPECGNHLSKGRKGKYFCDNGTCSIIFVKCPSFPKRTRIAASSLSITGEPVNIGLVAAASWWHRCLWIQSSDCSMVHIVEGPNLDFFDLWRIRSLYLHWKRTIESGEKCQELSTKCRNARVVNRWPSCLGSYTWLLRYLATEWRTFLRSVHSAAFICLFVLKPH